MSITSASSRWLLFAVLLMGVVANPAMAEDDVAMPTWTVPAGWAKLDGEKPMRVATFKAGEGANAVEVAVSVFPGDVGGLLGNVNRWRGQVKVAPLTQEQLATNITPFEVPGFAGNTMRIKGDAQHMLGAAIKEVKAERTWFIKILGAPAAIDAQEAAFVAFAKSFVPAK
jgi:hypothetical protein